MNTQSFYDIPSILNEQNLPYILKRLDEEQFSFASCLTPDCSNKFREILADFYTKKIDLNNANLRCCSEITPPETYKQIKGWQQRAVRSEISKVFTLGYSDYLLSFGETECFVPHTDLEHNDDCLRLIAGKKLQIKDVQDNIYKNYSLKVKAFPTVPLHANCQHIITKVSELEL
jgi:hypothetical protein